MSSRLKKMQRPWVVALAWAPVVALCAALADPLWPAALGLAAWPLVEYAAHRWAMHGLAGTRLYQKVHGVHHRYPRDVSHYFVPPVVGVPIGLAFVGLGWAALGRAGVALAGGIIAGYLGYEVVHWATHERPRWLRGLARHHARHHGDEGRFFAVSAPLLDRLMGTGRRKVRAELTDRGDDG